MALTEESGNGMVMPVTPMYGGGNGFGNGFGGDGWWIILLLLFAGGWGNGFGGGYGAGEIYPWMNQANLTSNGFQNQMLNDNVMSIRDGLHGISTQLCNGFAGVEQGANARQLADMQQMFNLQSQFANCCCENRLGIANLGSDIAREACATRTNDTQNTQSILNVINGGIQSIKDQLCQDKIDQKNDEINQLRQEILYAKGQASQDVQTATIQAGQRALANEVEQYVLPTPRPAYIVQNPNGCIAYNNCGCGM